MPRVEIETIRAAYEAATRGDWDAVFNDAPPDFELETADRVVNPGTYRGPAEARRFFEDLLEPFEEVSIEPRDFVSNGDQVVVLVASRLRPRGSAAVMETQIGHLWTIRDGELARLQIFPDHNDALAAAGIEP